jgi:hypothetical protein
MVGGNLVLEQLAQVMLVSEAMTECGWLSLVMRTKRSPSNYAEDQDDADADYNDDII